MYLQPDAPLAIRPSLAPLPDADAVPAAEPATPSRELMEAVATAPPLYVRRRSRPGCTAAGSM
jgi:hypothetical protein